MSPGPSACFNQRNVVKPNERRRLNSNTEGQSESTKTVESGGGGGLMLGQAPSTVLGGFRCTFGLELDQLGVLDLYSPSNAALLQLCLALRGSQEAAVDSDHKGCLSVLFFVFFCACAWVFTSHLFMCSCIFAIS